MVKWVSCIVYSVVGILRVVTKLYHHAVVSLSPMVSLLLPCVYSSKSIKLVFIYEDYSAEQNL